jgi:hypothetical protein
LFFRRAAVGVSVVTLGVLAFGTTAASAAGQPAHSTLNTYKEWDGSTYVEAFGCPNTTTYGETITIPAGKTQIKKFTFPWTDLGTGSMVVRGEVYAWNGSMATGSAVAESKPITVTSGHSGFYNVTFKVKNATVTPGSQYVIFASIDKDYSQCTNNYIVGWGLDTSDTYPGGTFVYLNSGGDASQWTTTPWNSFAEDIAFKASLSK